MKKLFLTFAVVFMAIAANAQVWMGGSFGFSSSKASKNANPVYNYSIAPEVGVSIAPRWDVAVALGYSGESAKGEILGINVKDVETAISVEPYVRYTAFDLGKVGFFIDGGFQYSFISEKITSGNHSESSSTNAYWIGLQPGIKFAASDNITFAARIGSLGYGATKEGASNFGFNVNNSAFTFGLWWNF